MKNLMIFPKTIIYLKMHMMLLIANKKIYKQIIYKKMKELKVKILIIQKIIII